MRRLTFLTFIAVFAVAFSACQSATNTNVANTTKTNANMNSNVAVVVPSNSNAATNSGLVVGTTNSNSWNANITREEYDKNKDDYASRAKSSGSTIGSGVNDGWLWTKAKAALATANDLRDSTINLDVDNAVVTLRGSVATEAQKKRAGEVAKVDGVSSVKNNLTVNAKDSMTNQMTSGNTTKTNSNTK
jgi:ABC-type Fe3+-hydroxamate transport system substrate-binding protein